MPEMPSRLRRVMETLLGLAIVGAAIWLAATTDRGDLLVMVLIGFGSFFVSKSLVAEAVREGLKFFRRGKVE